MSKSVNTVACFARRKRREYKTFNERNIKKSVTGILSLNVEICLCHIKNVNKSFLICEKFALVRDNTNHKKHILLVYT